MAAFIEKYQKSYPTAITWMPRDLEACLTFYAFPKEPDSATIRINNVVERLWQASQAPFTQDGSGFSQRRQLCVIVLCHHSELKVSQALDANRIPGATRLCDFTQPLTYYLG